MNTLETWELLSYVVTVVMLPLAIVVFILEQKKERINEEEELYQKLNLEYADFSKLLLQNSDLGLMSNENQGTNFTSEQLERKKIMFDLLISLFERAYILVHEDYMSPQTARLWHTWEDYIRFWCKRSDFRNAMEELLEGEDPEFKGFILKIALEKV